MAKTLTSFLFSTFFFCQSYADTIANISLWLEEKYSQKTCGNLDGKDFSRFQTILQNGNPPCLDSKTTQNPISLVKNYNEIAESVFFNRMAKTQLEQTNCEISNVRFFAKDESLIKAQAEDISNKLPLIKEQMALASLAYAEYQQLIGQNNNFAAYCRNSSGSQYREKCFEDLELKRLHERVAEQKWTQHRALVYSIIGGIWNGSTDSMSELVLKLSKQKQTPNSNEVFDALKRQIPFVEHELEKNKSELLKQADKNLNFNKLGDETKRQLVEAAIADVGLLANAAKDKDEASFKLLCRLEGKYTKGRDSFHKTIGIASLAVGGVAGIVTKIPLALRAGRMASIISDLKSSATIIGAMATGIDAAVMTSAVYKKCFSNSVTQIMSNACPTNLEDYKKSEIKRLNQNNCILDAALSIAPAGLLASSKAIKLLLPKLKDSSSTLGDLKKVGKASKAADGIKAANAVGTAESTAAASATIPNQAGSTSRIRDFSKNFFKPFHVPSSINSNNVTTQTANDIKSLEKIGVKFRPTNDPTHLEENVKIWKTTKLDTSPGQKPDYGKVLKIDELPPPGTATGPSTNAFLHPEIAAYKAKLEQMGYRLTVDTSSPFTQFTAYQCPYNKVISLRPDSSWQTFLHEFQHAEFSHYLEGSFDRLQASVANGGTVRGLMSPQMVQTLGAERVQRLQTLLEKGLPQLAINETLSVEAELRVMGFRRYIPFIGTGTEKYALRYQIDGLNKIAESGGVLSTEQVKALSQAKTRYAALLAYDTGGSAAAVGTLVAAEIGALNLYVKNRDKDPNTYLQIVYDDRDNVWGQRQDGSWVKLQKK